MTSLRDYLRLIDALLTHGRQHLDPHDWTIFTRRLVGTPLEKGYSVQEQWTARQMLAYYWPRLSKAEQDAFLREQRQPRRRPRQEVAP